MSTHYPRAGPGPGTAEESLGRSRRSGRRAELGLVVALVVVGVLVAFGWRLLTPHTAGLGDEQEAGATVDSTLALLGLAVGVLVGVLVLIRPGRSPVLRTLAVIIGSVLGGLVSWVLGDQLGTPALRAVGAAFVWPVATSAVLFLGALLPGTSNRLQPPQPPAPAVPQNIQYPF